MIAEIILFCYSFLNGFLICVCSSVVERCPDKTEVEGPIPSRHTTKYMSIKILDNKINIEEVKKLADFWYGTMIKGTVDVELRRVALGGDYHIESSEILTSSGSKFEDVWGFNIRFEENKDGVLEFDSMVNIKPNFGNRSRGINNQEVIKKATHIIYKFIDLK